MKRTQIYLDDRSGRDFLGALRAGVFGVWKKRPDVRPTETYLRTLRRGKRIDRFG
jgi:hypothetical protein